MAIIKPSKRFVGSDLSDKRSSKYIKEGVKQVVFNTKENKDGTYLYFLPPYTTDANGNGVWYKVFRIRDNFGDKFKEKYVPIEGGDAVDWFERNFKIHFPNEAKVVDEVDEGGKSRKRYPSYGRKTTRVIFNVAYANKLELGPHILDLPSYMGASQITDWLEAKDARGKEKPMLNDPSRCIPVLVKLKDGGSGNPWQIQPDANDPAELPDEVADSDNLYNLDTDVLEHRSDAELIAQLREMYRPEIFDLCMAGYHGFESVPTASVPALTKVSPSAEPSRIIKAKPVSAASPALKNVVEEEDNIPMDYVEDETPPAAVKPLAAKAEVSNFLRRKSEG